VCNLLIFDVWGWEVSIFWEGETWIIQLNVDHRCANLGYRSYQSSGVLEPTKRGRGRGVLSHQGGTQLSGMWEWMKAGGWECEPLMSKSLAKKY